MKAIITVLGKDKVGIICGVSAVLKDLNVNILDISQTIINDMFTMIMSVDLSKANADFNSISQKIDEEGKKLGVIINIQHEDIFNSMHKI
ncbi:MAG: ACT domain-containing protein [Ruminococcaceae bacterium]|nr:ACT domain-containing protein [Oscillospiraceae bacterium]